MTNIKENFRFLFRLAWTESKVMQAQLLRLFCSGSIVVTFDVNGAIEDMDAAVTSILTQLQNGFSVTINGNEYPSQKHLRIDGEDKWEDNVDVRKDASLKPSLHNFVFLLLEMI